MPEEAKCPSCGGATPEGSRFCPHCGTRLAEDTGSTAVIEPPPDETGPVPVQTQTVEPHLFGVTPPMALLALAVAALAVGILLLALGSTVAGAIVAGAGVALFGVFLSVARRRPDSRLTRTSAEAVEEARSRVSFAVGTLATRSRLQREVARLRADLVRLAERRRGLLHDLGRAVYEGDDAARDALRDELAEVDRTAETKETEMETIIARARKQVQRARLEVQRTEMVELPPQPGPGPAPGEANPPEPARIPEPYPPPGEADPPEPARIPEPYPPPDEGDPPEPARIPEPGGEGPSR